MRALASLITAPAASLALFVAMAPALAVLVLGAPAAGGLLREPVWIAAMLRSLLLAELAVVIAWPLGTLAALGIWGARRTTRRIVLGLGLLPLLIPPGWAARGLESAADQSGIEGAHLAALIAGHAVPAAAIVLLVLTGFLNRLDPAIRWTASASGASPGRTRRLVLLPNLTFPFVIAAAAACVFSLGQGVLDHRLAPAHHPSLAGLLASATAAHDATAAPAAFILTAMALFPLPVLTLLWLLRRHPA
jgi:ABC-type spermidine/putrescine transport system permease subunit II